MNQFLKHQCSLASKRASKQQKREHETEHEPDDFMSMYTGVQVSGVPLSGEGGPDVDVSVDSALSIKGSAVSHDINRTIDARISQLGVQLESS